MNMHREDAHVPRMTPAQRHVFVECQSRVGGGLPGVSVHPGLVRLFVETIHDDAAAKAFSDLASGLVPRALCSRLEDPDGLATFAFRIHQLAPAPTVQRAPADPVADAFAVTRIPGPWFTDAERLNVE